MEVKLEENKTQSFVQPRCQSETIYSDQSENGTLDDYKQRLLKFIRDPNEFKLGSMSELYKNGELEHSGCALYLAHQSNAVMRMPFQLNSILF